MPNKQSRITLPSSVDNGNGLLIHCFDDREIVKINNRGFIVNPLTEQIPAATTELLRCACEAILKVAHKNFDKVVGDDMISTGGTMLCIIRALRMAGVKIAHIVCFGEKVNYKGVDLIRKKPG